MEDIAELQKRIREAPRIPWEDRVYRWVSPRYPIHIPFSRDDCPTAGAYLRGARLNAKGVQAPLYTAVEPGIAALEVTRYTPEVFDSKLYNTIQEAEKFVIISGFQLFEIQLSLKKFWIYQEPPPGLTRS